MPIHTPNIGHMPSCRQEDIAPTTRGDLGRPLDYPRLLHILPQPHANQPWKAFGTNSLKWLCLVKQPNNWGSLSNTMGTKALWGSVEEGRALYSGLIVYQEFCKAALHMAQPCPQPGMVKKQRQRSIPPDQLRVGAGEGKSPNLQPIHAPSIPSRAAQMA
jgi:hypothetical protein